MKILLSLLGLGRCLWRLAQRAFEWMLADWRNGPLVLVTLALLAHIFVIDPALRERLASATDKLAEATEGWRLERQAHRQTVINHRNAAAEAQRQAVANVARVEAEQAAITQEIVDDYQVRLASARARFDQLRRDPTTRADPGRAGPAGLPGTSGTTGGADGATAPAGLPAAPGSVATWLTPEDALIATEQALQLDALIDWVEAQSQVDFVPQTPAGASAPLASAPVGATAGRPCGPHTGRDCPSEEASRAGQ